MYRTPRARSAGRRSRSGDSLAARAYEAIKADIASARLAPGAPIFEEDLARRLRMSRTPVREAVKRLEHENLLRRIPLRGVVVGKPSIRDIVEICEIRCVLEGHAARVAATRVSDGPLEALEEEFIALDVPKPDEDTVRRSSHVGRQLHQLILETAGNQHLIGIMSRLMDVINPLPFTLTSGRYHDTLQEHRAILAALQARDAEAARAAMERHIDAVRLNLHVLR